MRRTLFATALFVCVLSNASATVIYGPGSLNAPSVVSWNAYNPDYTTGTSGYFPFGSNNVVIDSVNNFSGANDGGVLEVRTQGSSWFGEMNSGEGVLFFHNDYSTTQSVFHLQFATAISGFALQSQSNRYGNYNVSLGAWNGAFPGGSAVEFGTTNGVSNGSQSGTQGWLGIQSATANITDVYIAVQMSDGSDTLGSGFGDLYIESQPVPEPMSMAVLGLGVAVLARRRRSKS